jgi:hypothetical protein
MFKSYLYTQFFLAVFFFSCGCCYMFLVGGFFFLASIRLNHGGLDNCGQSALRPTGAVNLSERSHNGDSTW